MELVKELINNDVLVLQTGAPRSLWPRPASRAGCSGHGRPGSQGSTVKPSGMPPSWALGACVDNSRILVAASEMVRSADSADSIADLPVAAPPRYG